MEPLVSILLPSYNHAAYVEATIRSVMVQKGVSFELLVVDDGSPDHSASLLQQLQHELGFTLILRENRGLVYSLNELLEKARGKFISTIASDDIMPFGRLAQQVAYMQNHPEVVASFGQIQNMDVNGALNTNIDPRYLPGVPWVSFEQLMLGIREVHGCTEMIQRDALLQVGGFPSEYRIEDFPLWLRLSRKFGPLAVLDSVHCYYRIHGSNMHRKLDFIYENVLQILEEHRDHPDYPEALSRWKANWFSSWAYQDKWEAWKRLPSLWSFSWHFLRRLPKLFIPRFFLRH